MNRWMIVLVLLLGSVTSVLSAPQLATEAVNYDFGDIIQGEKVEYVFRFRNTGDEILEVGNVRSSCGCTAALLSAKRIAAGDTGELKTTFDSTRFKGGVNKVVTIDTNDPKVPQLVFSMHGNVKAELLLQPERVNWGKVPRDAPLTSKVIITNQGSASVNLQPPRATDPAVSAELNGLQLKPGAQVELEIAAKFPEQKKRIGGYVIIATDYPKVPQLRVSVSARLSE